MFVNVTFFIIFRWAIERVNLMGDNRITGDISTDPLAAKSRTVSADEVKLKTFANLRFSNFMVMVVQFRSKIIYIIHKLLDTLCVLWEDLLLRSIDYGNIVLFLWKFCVITLPYINGLLVHIQLSIYLCISRAVSISSSSALMHIKIINVVTNQKHYKLK